jgi:hypothetical protein
MSRHDALVDNFKTLDDIKDLKYEIQKSEDGAKTALSFDFFEENLFDIVIYHSEDDYYYYSIFVTEEGVYSKSLSFILSAVLTKINKVIIKMNEKKYGKATSN